MHIAPLSIPIALLALSVTISGAFNGGEHPGEPGPHSLPEAWKSFASLKSLIPYFWTYEVSQDNPGAARSSVLLLLSVSALSGIWGAIQQLFDIHPGTFKYLQATGFLYHPMAFAGQMQIFSMLALGLYLNKVFELRDETASMHHIAASVQKTILHPLVFLLIVAANFAGLFFAGERSAWIGGIAGILAMALLKSRAAMLKSSAAIAILAGASWCFIPLVKKRIETLFTGHDVSVSVRQKIWAECLSHYFPQSPLFGIGWMKFPHFDIPEAIVPGVSKDINHAHSNYVQFLTAAGIFGLFSYVVLILWTLKVAYTKLQNSARSNDLFSAGAALGIFGAAISLAASGVFEYNFGTAQVRLAQWFVFGLL